MSESGNASAGQDFIKDFSSESLEQAILALEEMGEKKSLMILQPHTCIMPIWYAETLTPEEWIVLGCRGKANEIWWNTMPERGIL